MKCTKLIILFIIAIAVSVVVSGCARKPAVEPTGIEQATTSTTQAVATTTEQENVATANGGAATTSAKQDAEIYKGELTEEENGWKRYRNKNLGIEFKFQDIGNDIKLYAYGDGVMLLENNIDGHPLIYIDLFSIGNQFSPLSLKEYLENGAWKQTGYEDELVYIKEITNNNNVLFYEVKYRGYSKNQTAESGFKEGYYTGKYYWADYHNKNQEENMLFMHGNEDLQEDIVKTFKFLE